MCVCAWVRLDLHVEEEGVDSNSSLSTQQGTNVTFVVLVSKMLLLLIRRDFNQARQLHVAPEGQAHWKTASLHFCHMSSQLRKEKTKTTTHSCKLQPAYVIIMYAIIIS